MEFLFPSPIGRSSFHDYFFHCIVQNIEKTTNKQGFPVIYMVVISELTYPEGVQGTLGLNLKMSK